MALSIQFSFPTMPMKPTFGALEVMLVSDCVMGLGKCQDGDLQLFKATMLGKWSLHTTNKINPVFFLHDHLSVNEIILSDLHTAWATVNLTSGWCNLASVTSI